MKTAPQTAFPLDSTPSNAAGKVEGAEKGIGAWRPIETAPRNGEIRIIIAEFNHDGELTDIDFDAIYEQECESWELPQPYWVWKSAFGRVEDPTHWMPLPDPPTL
jgi:hypothetical protein